ncbi:MAG: hypothetical protein LAT76_11385, partial [Schleiferiaceae bacterium]|nr:hypothetical protein [Schleiferiaceae bacterium]
MKKFLSIAFLLLLNFSALKAQTPDLNLTVTQNDRVVGGFIRVKVQIRELAPGGFTLGPSNIRIRYKMAGLANPTISSNFLPTFQSITLTNNLNQPTGFNRLSVNLNCINIFGCPGVFVGSNFVDLVELQFEILSLNETLDFDILINDGGFGNTVLKEFPDLNYYGGTTMDQIIWNGTSW